VLPLDGEVPGTLLDGLGELQLLVALMSRLASGVVARICSIPHSPQPSRSLAGALLAGALLAKQHPVHRDVPSAPGRLGPQLPRDTQSGFLPPLFHYPAAVTLTLTSFG
jgi:hypothetical protein